MKAALRFSKRARADWSRLDEQTKVGIATALEAMRELPPPANLDDKPLEGRAPWRRLRVGGHRVIFRVFTRSERVAHSVAGGYVVEHVIDRRDLDRATKGLR